MLFKLLALAIYNRSPSTYQAVKDLRILKLPCSKILTKVIKSNSENPGIDEQYLSKQQEEFQSYKIKRKAGGHPEPLGVGNLIWDEVKVGVTKLRLCSFQNLYAPYSGTPLTRT